MTGEKHVETELLQTWVYNENKVMYQYRFIYLFIEGKTKPFIDVLLDVGEDNISEQDFFDHLISIVGAGSDTISNGINFTLFLLANYPEYQKRVHEEIDAAFWGDMDRDVTMSDLSTELPYLEMCLKESLRIYPPIPLMSRKMLFDVKLGN